MRWQLLLIGWVACAQTNPPPAREAQRTAGEQQRAAMARQREAIRKQADSLGLWLPPRTDEPKAPEPAASVVATVDQPCDPLDTAAALPIVDSAAKANSLEPRLLRAVIEQESGWRPCAVSPKGAKGLMQLMPDTAQDLGVQDVFDAQENVSAGAKYLKQLVTKYQGDLSLALSAYNAGPSAVDQAGGIPNIRETRDYVNSILKKIGAPKPL